MPVDLDMRLSRYLGCDVRCQLLVHGQRVVHMFDTVIVRITPLDDGGFLVAYDGGAINVSDAEIVDHPEMLIVKARDDSWSLVVTRWADMPGDIQPFPRASRQ